MQDTLFPAAPTVGTSRHRDLDTSKQAAESLSRVVLGAMQAEVLGAYESWARTRDRSTRTAPARAVDRLAVLLDVEPRTPKGRGAP